MNNKPELLSFCPFHIRGRRVFVTGHSDRQIGIPKRMHNISTDCQRVCLAGRIHQAPDGSLIGHRAKYNTPGNFHSGYKSPAGWQGSRSRQKASWSAENWCQRRTGRRRSFSDELFAPGPAPGKGQVSRCTIGSQASQRRCAGPCWQL